MITSKNVPPAVLKLYQEWNFFFKTWWLVHYIVGIVGVTSAITVANNPKFLQTLPSILDFLAWISAVCVTLLTFLEPKKRARAYVAAWRILHKEIGIFQYGSTDNPAVLFEAIKKGKDIIAQLDV